jgi:hypothetical protein
MSTGKLLFELYFEEALNPFVDQYHHDSGIITGYGEFKPYTVPNVTGIGNKDSGDWPIDNLPTAQMSEMSSVQYLFQNSNTFPNGIGIGLRVVEDDDESKGFCLGYEVHASKENQLAAKDGVALSIKDFYDDDGNGPSDRPMQVETTIRSSTGNNKITDSTNAPGGLPGPFTYKFVVTIG